MLQTKPRGGNEPSVMPQRRPAQTRLPLRVLPGEVNAPEPAAPAQPTCATCKFFCELEVTKFGVGVCRRYPPTTGQLVHVEETDPSPPGTTGLFPGVMPDSWCGEHRERTGPPRN